MDEREETEEHMLDKIIDNFEDYEEPPPNYFDVVPVKDSEAYPHVKILLSVDYNTKKNLLEYLNINKKDNDNINKNDISVNNSKINATNLKHSFNTKNVDDEFKTNNKPIQKHNDNDKKDEDAKKAAMEEKLIKDNRDLEKLNEEFEKLNLFTKKLYSDFDYLHTNADLNEKNKKIKITELIENITQRFELEVKKFNELKFESNYLENLKVELLTFVLTRYELIVKFIIEVKNLNEKNLYKEIKIN